MPHVTVDCYALRDVSQLLSAYLLRPRQLAETLEEWAKDVDEAEALKTLGDLGYGDKIRAVKQRILAELDDLADYSAIMCNVADVYEKTDNAVAMLLDSDDEKIKEMLFESYGEKEVYSDSFDWGAERSYKIVDAKYFGFEIHGYNYKVETRGDGSVGDYNADVDAGVAVSGPCAGGLIRLGSKDAGLFLEYEASGPGAEANASGHGGKSGLGGSAKAQVQSYSAKLAATVRVDDKALAIEGSVGKSKDKGVGLPVDVDLDESKATVSGKTKAQGQDVDVTVTVDW